MKISDKNNLDRLCRHIEAQRDLLLLLQAGMTALPAISPDSGGEGEEAKALFIKDQIVRLGLPAAVDLNAPDERVPCGYRPNFYTLLPGENKNMTMWIAAHIDVVPPGDLSAWHSNPFELKVDGDFIYGRGVEDNQQAVVTGLLALKAFVDEGVTPPCNLALLCLSDEETRNTYGAGYIAQNFPELFGPDDIMLVPDFGLPDASMLEVAEKGVLWLKFTVHGKQCHASTPHEGVNSLLAASELILRLESLSEKFTARNELFDPPVSTFTPTMKEANVPNVNTMPGRDVFYMDCRILPECSIDKVLEAVGLEILALESKRGVKVELNIEERREPAPITDPEHYFLRSLQMAVQDVYGVLPQPQGIGGNTVSAYFRKMNIPCAVWARLVGNAHMPNECSCISWTMADAKVVCTLASRLSE